MLCVGNTLLLNGTIHSPPYVVAGVGASKDRFDADPLVKQLKADAVKFGLRVAVTRETSCSADWPPNSNMTRSRGSAGE